MKHFLSFLVLSFSIACFTDNQPQTSDKKELKGATYKVVATNSSAYCSFAHLWCLCFV